MLKVIIIVMLFDVTENKEIVDTTENPSFTISIIRRESKLHGLVYVRYRSDIRQISTSNKRDVSNWSRICLKTAWNVENIDISRQCLAFQF